MKNQLDESPHSLLQWNNSSLPNKRISFRNTSKNDNLTFLGGYRQDGAHQLQTLLVGITHAADRGQPPIINIVAVPNFCAARIRRPLP